MDTYKGWIIKTGIVFIIVLLLLTFFSSTIYNFNLPSVTVGFPKDGVIRETATGEGIVDFVETQPFYTNSKGKIQLLVSEGDIVETGSRLYSMLTDIEDLEKSLETLKNEYDKTMLKIDKTTTDLEYIRNTINNTKVDLQEQDRAYETEISNCDIEIQTLLLEISHAEDELKKIKTLFDSGAVPESDLTEKQNELDKQQNKYQQVLEKKQKAEDNYNKSLQDTKEDAQKSYEEKINLLQKDLKDLDFQLKEYILDKNAQEQSIENINEQINNSGTLVVTSDNPGKITSISDIDDGAYVELNSFIMKLGITERNYYSVLKFSENVNYIHVDDKVNLNVKSKEQYNLQGIVKQVYNQDGFLNVKVEFSAIGLSGGESIETKVENTSEIYQSLIANTAVRFDSQEGYYILFAEKIKSSFGYEYYARKMPINVQMQDIKNTAFYIYTDDRLPVIINSDKAIAADDRIRIVGGSDIVEIR